MECSPTPTRLVRDEKTRLEEAPKNRREQPLEDEEEASGDHKETHKREGDGTSVNE